MCSQPLLSLLWQVTDKLKIKSTRKIIYKSTSQAHAFYPYCSINVLPLPQSGENQYFPHSTPASPGCTPEPDLGGVGGGSSSSTQLKIKTLVLEPYGHLGTPLSAPPGSPPGALAELRVLRSCLWPRAWGRGKMLQTSIHALLILLGRNSKKADRDLRTEEKNPKCSHSYTESLWQIEHLAALNIGVSPFYSTQAF